MLLFIIVCIYGIWFGWILLVLLLNSPKVDPPRYWYHERVNPFIYNLLDMTQKKKFDKTSKKSISSKKPDTTSKKSIEKKVDPSFVFSVIKEEWSKEVIFTIHCSCTPETMAHYLWGLLEHSVELDEIDLPNKLRVLQEAVDYAMKQTLAKAVYNSLGKQLGK